MTADVRRYIYRCIEYMCGKNFIKCWYWKLILPRKAREFIRIAADDEHMVPIDGYILNEYKDILDRKDYIKYITDAREKCFDENERVIREKIYEYAESINYKFRKWRPGFSDEMAYSLKLTDEERSKAKEIVSLYNKHFMFYYSFTVRSLGNEINICVDYGSLYLLLKEFYKEHPEYIDKEFMDVVSSRDFKVHRSRLLDEKDNMNFNYGDRSDRIYQAIMTDTIAARSYYYSKEDTGRKGRKLYEVIKTYDEGCRPHYGKGYLSYNDDPMRSTRVFGP